MPELAGQILETPLPNPKARRGSLHRITHHPFPQDALAILHNPHFNKGTAFTQEERDKYHLRGLLPETVETLEQQVCRALAQCRHFTIPLSKHIYLNSLRERNETLFYRLVVENLIEMMPLIYTPTVGEGCLQFGWQYRQTEGMYISSRDLGRVAEVLRNWRVNIRDEVAFIVVTDGSRILGLGDLGANGMGIPIGKSSLYVAAGGFHPATALPVVLDLGTNNPGILCDEFYLGAHHKRLSDDQYYPLVDEFLTAVSTRWPRCLIQFEDFSNDHAFELLGRYRDKMLCFNDDIQGTGCVIAAGFMSALRIRGAPDWSKDKIMVLGSGAAAVGVANQICHALVFKYQISFAEAKSMFCMVDSKGLVSLTRGDPLPPFKKEFAREDGPQFSTFKEALFHFSPFAIVGLSTTPDSFDAEVLQFMEKTQDRPIIMPLSNPTNKSECSAEAAYKLTKGRCLFASGSPYSEVTVGDQVFRPSQGNNLYTFPGIGFGSWLCGAEKITDGMLTAATVQLAECVGDAELSRSELYPDLRNIRETSANVATAVIKRAVEEGLASEEIKDDILFWVKESMYFPAYC